MFCFLRSTPSHSFFFFFLIKSDTGSYAQTTYWHVWMPILLQLIWFAGELWGSLLWYVTTPLWHFKELAVLWADSVTSGCRWKLQTDKLVHYFNLPIFCQKATLPSNAGSFPHYEGRVKKRLDWEQEACVNPAAVVWESPLFNHLFKGRTETCD